MKTQIRISLAIGLLALCGFGGNSCVVSDRQEISFRGIPAVASGEPPGLYNPERGFRLEVALDVAGKTYLWEPEKYPDITSYLEKEAAAYAADSVSLVQTYFYLTGASDRDLTEEDFETMSVFLGKLREMGKKAVLRFAYETQFAGRAPVGPTKERIIRHTRQLKPFLEKHKDVIQVVQAGMIGAWGEWHSSVYGLENSEDTKRNILQAICRMTPEERYVQVRVPAYKNLLDTASTDYKRVSFHDDFIVIRPHPWDGEMSEGTPAFHQIVRESPWLPVDGELPWGSWSMQEDPDNPDSGWIIDGPQTARRLFLQHFTSLSLIHNYKEKDTKDKYSMQYWKETPITEAFLQENHLPVSDRYFENEAGEKVERTAFDYIRDHLGYRLELQSLKAPSRLQPGKRHPIELTFINRGFSTLFNEHAVRWVLINDKGEICNATPVPTDVREWQPYAPGDSSYTPLLHTLAADLSVPDNLPAGTYRLGLWIPDGSESLMYNHRYAIRCANGDTKWWVSPDGKYGVNVLATLIR